MRQNLGMQHAENKPPICFITVFPDLWRDEVMTKKASIGHLILSYRSAVAPVLRIQGFGAVQKERESEQLKDGGRTEE